jgi:hypothetical protein
MAVLGKLTPGLRAARAGSFQLFISPVKIPHAVAAFSLSVVMPGRLYMKLRPPATTGMYSKLKPGAGSAADDP